MNLTILWVLIAVRGFGLPLGGSKAEVMRILRQKGWKGYRETYTVNAKNPLGRYGIPDLSDKSYLTLVFAWKGNKEILCLARYTFEFARNASNYDTMRVKLIKFYKKHFPQLRKDETAIIGDRYECPLPGEARFSISAVLDTFIGLGPFKSGRIGSIEIEYSIPSLVREMEKEESE